ncbi:MAG: type 2 isopentenyl-diphosphate Delta-isomerase [Firmicutes bacterium]|nr:type 2 isopentenyl-diphosphate Delta-isomerase [Bacillota bacterium]
MSRQERKREHLLHAVSDELTCADFQDVHFIHNCLPETAYDALDLSTTIAGLKLPCPLLLNAITGGVEEAEEINRGLAEAARTLGLAMAVGSQTAALENPAYSGTYTVVRRVNPKGVVFANVGADVDADQAQRAVEMVEADALQVHLNAGQELLMKEGDRDFRGRRKRLADIVRKVSVPVIVKETGCGIAREQAAIIQELGAAAIDVGGRGGTNFLEIESRRSQKKVSDDLLQWGIPTPLAILEAKNGAPELDLIASGGINTGLLAAKAVALGANAVAVAGLAVKVLLGEGREALLVRLGQLLEELKIVMLLTGCTSVPQLKQAPLVLTGLVREWMDARRLTR